MKIKKKLTYGQMPYLVIVSTLIIVVHIVVFRAVPAVVCSWCQVVVTSGGGHRPSITVPSSSSVACDG